MKKLIYTIMTALSIFGATSCSDMLETESTRQVFDPELNTKGDSVFYALGIMQAMQQLADQYYFQNELRGDLVKTTEYTDDNLRALANYSATAENKYDSVYLYYKVINNCNYYLAHRDTALYTGATNVAINEYIAVASFRAWAYLQASRIYGKLPYVTEPVTTISQINSNAYQELSINELLAKEAEYLATLKKRYPKATVPTFGNLTASAGSTNWGSTKNINFALCCIPLDVVLGDMYLEIGNYQDAAICYFDYLNSKETTVQNRLMSTMPYSPDDTRFPGDYMSMAGFSTSWENVFAASATPVDVISYIPMAVNYTQGKVTEVPDAFGYDYYSSKRTFYSSSHFNNCPQKEQVQLVPSNEYMQMADTATYYYYKLTADTKPTKMGSYNIGDGRASMIVSNVDSTGIWVEKPANGNIYLYRNSTVFLHLAEALNRMGYPDAAFAVLKDGIQYDLRNVVIGTEGVKNCYITQKTMDLFTTGCLPFFADANVEKFKNKSNDELTDKDIRGIHSHGCGYTGGITTDYQYDNIVASKIAHLNKKFGLDIQSATLDDQINAVEDLICDEYAMEFAFEGTRFSDLQRIARHKNEKGLYGSNFGSVWFADKLRANNPQVNLLEPSNWYLPFK